MSKGRLAGALAATALSACASTPHTIQDRQDYLAEATRTYEGEDRERVIAAAETVLKLSDPQDWDFRYTVDGFVGLRRYVVYAVLVSQVGQEKWQLVTEVPAPGVVKASISVSEAGVAVGGYAQNPYEHSMASIPLYRLFWARVDYMLGKRPDWITCASYVATLKKSATSSDALAGLCGSTSQGANAPPPPPLPARPGVVGRPSVQAPA